MTLQMATKHILCIAKVVNYWWHIQLLAYGIRNGIHKITIDYGKFHLTHDVTLLLFTGRSKMPMI